MSPSWRRPGSRWTRAGETAFQLGPLPVPEAGAASAGQADAVELFAQRAAAAVPGFTVTPDNLGDIVTICRRLDGLPLAIELAAVRLRALPLHQMAERIEDRLRLLTGGRRSGTPRHQTLRAAVEWSYSLCPPAEQLLWARLSVFAGNFDIAAAEEVCAGGGLAADQVLPAIISLVDKNVLVREDGCETGPAFRMPGTLREFGAERLDAADPQPAAVRRRLVARCLALAERFEQAPAAGQLAQYQRLRREHDNLRAAFGYALALPGNDGAAVVLATSLFVYWQISGLLREAEYWLDQVAVRCPGRSAARARVLATRGYIRVLLGDFASGRADAEDAVAMAVTFGDAAAGGRGYSALHRALTFGGNLAEAEQAAGSAVACLTAAGDTAGLAQLDVVDAMLRLQAGAPGQCCDSAARGLARLPGGERWCAGSLHEMRALGLFLRGDIDRARTEAGRALELRHQLGDVTGTAFGLGTLAFIAAAENRYERTAWLLGASAPLWERTGRWYTGAPAFESLHQVAERVARAGLGDERFWRLRAEGRGRPPGRGGRAGTARRTRGQHAGLVRRHGRRGCRRQFRPAQFLWTTVKTNLCIVVLTRSEPGNTRWNRGGVSHPRPREESMLVGQITRQRGQLPVETTGFVGRDAELARLGALLGQARLITVTGPPGVGKTRLALRAAARAAGTFADGVALVELSAVDDPRLLPDAVAAALGLPEAGPEAGADPVLGYLSDRHLLLILDTGEHLADACAMFAEAVIARAPRVTLLATSREPLDVSGENACPVAPLPVPEPDGPAGGGPADLARWRGTAVDLFAQRASAAVPGLVLPRDDLRQVLRIVRRLDGLPLAIELAALRLRALPLADLASRLDQTLALLASGHQRGRHSSLQDAVAWSYRLCPPAEQALWARLSLFAGPFTMSAAEDVCADPPRPGLPGSGSPGSGLPGSGSRLRLAQRSPGHADADPAGGQVAAGQDRPGPGRGTRGAHPLPDAGRRPRVRRRAAGRDGSGGAGHRPVHPPLPGPGPVLPRRLPGRRPAQPAAGAGPGAGQRASGAAARAGRPGRRPRRAGHRGAERPGTAGRGAGRQRRRRARHRAGGLLAGPLPAGRGQPLARPGRRAGTGRLPRPRPRAAGAGVPAHRAGPHRRRAGGGGPRPPPRRRTRGRAAGRLRPAGRGGRPVRRRAAAGRGRARRAGPPAARRRAATPAPWSPWTPSSRRYPC